MRILLFTLLSLLLPISLVEAQNATGVYDTDFKEMTIQQDGSKFTGTYKWADGRLDGTISGHTASGWWYQSNGKGKFVFDFNSDFTAFTGKWGRNDATPSGQWNGKRIGGASAPASAIVLLGTYDTDFKEMTIQREGNKITGTYKWSDGRIEGTISGHTVTGWWYQSNGKGKFVFEFNSDFSAFTGKWGRNDATPSGQWNGKRIGGASAPASAPAPVSAPAPAMVSLGTYDTDFNEMTIQRNGNKITGTYKWSDGRIEGTLSGHTVTGWWYQSNGKGKFVFNFNSDFSAFTGKWGRNDATPSGQWNGKRK